MCRAESCVRPAAYRSKTCRARTLRGCDECGRQINSGESYRYDFFVVKGSAGNLRICAHCMVPIHWLTENCGGWVFGEVREEIEKHAEEYPALAEQLLRSVDGMKDGWRRDAQLLPVPPMPDSIDA